MLFSLFGSPPIPNSPAWDILIFPNFGEVKINIATNTITPKIITMKHLLATSISIALLSLGVAGCSEKQAAKEVTQDAFVTIQGQDLIKPDGTKLFIMGTNLGNWLNPEGYMFRFSKTNSGRFINEMFCQLVGPDFTADFWKAFKDNYITREDIRFIKSRGANTIRLPFHYKLFTDEDYMGLTTAQDGFARVDSLVDWCRESDLYLILDMHDAPGGQTGDNIDDSYGYPWLFDSEASQQLYCDIWRRIADRYKNEPVRWHTIELWRLLRGCAVSPSRDGSSSYYLDLSDDNIGEACYGLIVVKTW